VPKNGQVLLANLVMIARSLESHVRVDLADISAELSVLAIVAKPAGEGRLPSKATSNEACRSDCAEHSVRGHETPMLLRAVDHPVDQVSIADAFSRLVKKLERLQLRLLWVQTRVHLIGLRAKVVLLNHQEAKLMIVEVKLNLVVQCRLAGRCEEAASKHLLADVPGFQNDMLLP
jgi:hypothetical protein